MSKQPWKRIIAFLYFTQGVTINGEVASKGWLAEHKEDTKFNYAVARVNERALKCNEEMKVKIEDLEREHQATGDHQVLIYNPDKSRAYTAAGEIALRDAKAKLGDVEFEIEPHYCSELPELPDNVREVLTGFVIKPEAKIEAVA